jgi:septum site-determining protein MinD
MVKTDDMMSIDDVQNILGIPLIGIIPDSEEVIIASNRGEPLVLEEKLSLPGLAFENTAYRLEGKKVDFLNLEVTTSQNPVRRLLGNFIKKSNNER